MELCGRQFPYRGQITQERIRQERSGVIHNPGALDQTVLEFEILAAKAPALLVPRLDQGISIVPGKREHAHHLVHETELESEEYAREKNQKPEHGNVSALGLILFLASIFRKLDGHYSIIASGRMP
jgi:hypothetical protein